MHIEVVYALPREQEILRLELPEGATAAHALRDSGLLERYPEITNKMMAIGIWGKVVNLDTPLHDQDRVEIYRDLVADPKVARRRRATNKATK
jgi:putative ubiquitin-RnfH superfamily antitoxin RatB of RatAB toxin-antitoxin module